MLTRDANEADDLAQDAMMKAFSAIDRLAAGTNARAWLMTILRNAHIDRVRAVKGNQVSLDALDVDPPAPEPAVAEDTSAWTDPDRMLAELSDERILAAMQSVPAEICWTLLLVDVEGLDDREAAEILKIPPGTVKSRLHRGRRMLREKLANLQVRR